MPVLAVSDFGIADNVDKYWKDTLKLTVVGHDSVIGSSVWLTKSVDPHTMVVLEKPKLRIRAENTAETFDGVLDYQI